MARDVYRSGQLVPARMREIYLTDEEYSLLCSLSERSERTKGEVIGNLLRSADIRARRIESQNAAEERRLFRLRAVSEEATGG